MKKILFFTSVLFLVFATNLQSQTIPTVTNVVISDSILCNGELAELTIDISQSSPPSNPLEIVIGSFPLSFNPAYFVKTTTASVLTINTITIPGLPAGEYTIRLVNPDEYYDPVLGSPTGNGTSVYGIYSVYGVTVNIVQPDSLLATTSPTVNNPCYGDCMAEEIMLVEGGTPPYSYIQNGVSLPIANNTQSFVGLCADTYTVTVTDDNGCPTQNVISPPELTTFYVSQPNDLVPNGSVSSDYNGYGVSCNGANNGEITASIINNHIVQTTASMTFSPSVLSINLGDTVTFVNTGGNHNVNGTLLTFPSNPDGFGNNVGTGWTYSYVFTTPGVYNYQCDPHVSMGMTGTILVSISGGGTPPIEYSIDGINFSTNSVFNNLSAGNYTITYKDNNNCEATEQLVITEPPALSGVTSITDAVSCYGVCDGELEFTVDASQIGVPSYQYSIDGGINFQNSNNFFGLCGDTSYAITVKYIYNC